MSAQEVEKSIREIWELFKDTDRRMKETDREIKETRRTVERVNESVAALTGKWGKFVEGLIVPAVERLFKERGIEVDKVSQRVRARKNGRNLEVDIMAINGETVVLIEVKSTLKVADVEEHLQRLTEFKLFFPEYQERRVYGAVAGIVMDEGADRYAYRNGLFVIGEKGETVKILNDEKFRPKVF